jgi:hypothetical protein
MAKAKPPTEKRRMQSYKLHPVTIASIARLAVGRKSKGAVIEEAVSRMERGLTTAATKATLPQTAGGPS